MLGDKAEVQCWPAQLLLVLQVTAVPLKYQVLPAAVVVAPAMPVDSQAMQLKGWEVKLKVTAAAARAGAVPQRVCVTGCAF